MIKLSEEGMSREAENYTSLSVSQIVNAKDKFFTEINNAPVNTGMVSETALLLIWRNC